MGSTEAMYSATRAERFEKWMLNDSFPPSYSAQTTAEADWLSRADAFRAQYHEFYPRRAPLLLTPLNECHARKMICTFIKPTLLPYEDLFDLPVCVRFLSAYLRFEPLEDHERLPAVVVSPATTLAWQVGNCIELSLVAASLLAGAGYNAHVVVGYARRFVFAHDYSAREWIDSEGLFDESDGDGDGAAEEPMDAEYGALLRERPLLRGVHDGESPAGGTESRGAQAAGDLAGRGGSRGPGAHSGTVLPPPPAGKEGEGRLLHAWVLVLPGGRKCHKEAVYVEPSTGELIAPESADTFYTGIESVFSARDVYVNIVPETPVSAMTVDLHDATRWEALVLDADALDAEAFDGSPHEISPGHTVASLRAEDHRNMSLTTAGRRRHGDLSSTLSGVGIGVAMAGITARDRAHGAAGNAGANANLIAVPARCSWVTDLTLSRAQYESRYPGGTKRISYANADVRLFAAYVMPDLRVMEVRLPDPRYRDQHQLHVLFAHREDKLRRRTLLPAPQETESASFSGLSGSIDGGGWRMMKEWYDRGRMREASVEGLRCFTHEYGVHRTMVFYDDSRDDGLWRRDELFFEGLALRKIKELYRHRDDRLWYRGASFDRSATTAVGNRPLRNIFGGGALASENGAGRSIGSTVPQNLSMTVTARAGASSVPASTAGETIQRVDPVRLSEKYLRNPSLAADTDVAKLTFVRPVDGNGSGQVWVFFHYREGSVIRPHRMYAKAARSDEYLAAAMGSDSSPHVSRQCASIALMPNAEPPTEIEQYNERQRLLWHESVCINKIRSIMQECHEILVSMREVNCPGAVLSAFDTLRNHPRETEAERARKVAEEATREESRRDYLAPYIAKLDLPSSFGGDYLSVALSAEQARQVRDQALRELKERLIQRGNIMQGHMNREKEIFNKKQAAYQSSQDAAGVNAGHEEEEFALYCKEATWRMKTLDERLAKHIDQASEKYAKLAARLAEDPRLAALYTQSTTT